MLIMLIFVDLVNNTMCWVLPAYSEWIEWIYMLPGFYYFQIRMKICYNIMFMPILIHLLYQIIQSLNEQKIYTYWFFVKISQNCLTNVYAFELMVILISDDCHLRAPLHFGEFRFLYKHISHTYDETAGTTVKWTTSLQVILMTFQMNISTENIS